VSVRGGIASPGARVARVARPRARSNGMQLSVTGTP
jgi:hypothetical protein